MEISGLAVIFSEKVAVTVTTPEVITLSESLLVRVNVACDGHVPQFGKLIDWKNLDDLIPRGFRDGSKYKKTGKAGIFAGSLELVKEGNLSIKQENLYGDIYIKEIND